MRPASLRHLSLGLFTLLAVSSMVSTVSAARIDATPGKKYAITRQHGPWMIMVASLSDTPEQRRKAGISPEEAADELVYALRRKGIPAYAFRIGEVKESGQSNDRAGRVRQVSYKARQEGISVLAGNYDNVNGQVAQKTLAYLKGLSIEDLHLENWSKHGVFRSTPGQPKPFSGAFLTINPLLTQEEIAQRRRDPLLLRLNSGGEYSILENKGKYTLVVASFKGRSETSVGQRNFQKALENFKVSSSLDEAAERAWRVAKLLREGRINGDRPGPKFEAYVLHERYSSTVTVGAFDSPQDPRLTQLAETFNARHHVGENGKSYTTGYAIMMPGDPNPVVFDPQPRLISVPQLR